MQNQFILIDKFLKNFKTNMETFKLNVQAQKQLQDELDWKEDYAYEDVLTMNVCYHCENKFLGNKKRILCYKCANKLKL